MNNIMIIVTDNRTVKATELQSILTEFGCIVKVRLGIHETQNTCSEEGIIILQLSDDKEKIEQLENQLNKIVGVKVKSVNI